MVVINNPIYDMLTRIRNGQLAKKKFILQPKNRFCLRLLNIIYKEGYIKHYSFENEKTLKIWLKYYNNQPVIKKISFFSTNHKKPTYISLKNLWKLDSSLRLIIASTTKGFLSGKNIRKKKVGGKLICIIE
uniref:Ribosomal protein S8 n=1 Tax=Chattonella marina TaxID=90936 RepID=D2Z1Z3_9STRA|nr:ribosomal protein S8 [Chattonella marina]BAI70557.1 ribosomal protein S8 [Chattonella marina]